MKSIVIYHSLSGNTKKIAEAIHTGISKSGESCDIARLRDVDTADLAGYDLIGLGSLVICGREPKVVANFIQDTMKFVDGKHAFAFSTHGALPAYYFAWVVPAMIQRGLTVIGWDDWFCDVTYPVTPSPYFIDGHPDAIDLKEAEDFGRGMIERSRRISQGETNLIPTLPRGSEYDEMYVPVEIPPKEYMEEWGQLMKAIVDVELKVNTEKCKYPKCTLCIDNCPSGSIDFSVSPPAFRCSGSDMCYHCEQICPNGAIEANYEPFKSSHDLFTEVLLKKSLELFEAQGRFRSLIPPEEIGWDTPFYKSRKHPRYKIK
jgi:ferredoxin